MDNTMELHTAESGLFPFDPIVLLRDVLKRWLLILAVAVMVGVGSYILADSQYQPVYQTSATMVVSSRGSSSTVYSNLTSASSVGSVFSELVNSSLMRKVIMEQAGLERFDGSISATILDDTNLINLVVKDSDPRTAFLVINAILDYHHVVTNQVVDEVILEVPIGSITVDEVCTIMNRNPVWADGLPLASAGFTGEHYFKDYA